MKKLSKKFLLLFILTLTLFFAGCSNAKNVTSDDFDKIISELKNELNQIKEDTEFLNDTIDILTQDNEDLMQNNNKLNADILIERGRINAANNIISKSSDTIKELQDTITELKEGGIPSETVEVFLADEYQLVINDNFQLFYHSVIQAANPYGYYIKVRSTVGHAYNRYYEFCPETSDLNDTYDLEISVCDNNGAVLGTDSTKLIVSSANNTKVSTPKNILCIGDSLTASGAWVSQGYTKYTNDGGTTINLLGTKTGSNVKYEGISGWQWSSFVSNTSPFYDSALSRIDFNSYCTKNNYSGIDELYILLTYNGLGGSWKNYTYTDSLFSNAKKLIDQYHEDFPNGKVTLLSIPQPSLHGGLGAYYLPTSGYGDNYGMFVSVLRYDDMLEKFSNQTSYKTFVRYVDSKAQFDSENNMPTELKPVNNENTATEKVGNAMGIHPSTNGYKQIGDVFYRALCSKWQ